MKDNEDDEQDVQETDTTVFPGIRVVEKLILGKKTKWKCPGDTFTLNQRRGRERKKKE